MYDSGGRYGTRRNGKNTGGWHVPEAGKPDKAVRHSRDLLSGIVRGGSERQDRSECDRQLDTSLVPIGYNFSNSANEDSSVWGSSQKHTIVGFRSSSGNCVPLQQDRTRESPTVFGIARMASRTYLGRNRSDNENDRQLESFYYKNNRNSDKVVANFVDDEPAEPHPVNTIHLQNPYRIPQKLEGFVARNSSFKGPHRSRESNFQSKHSHLPTGRRDASTVTINDADDDRNKISRLHVRKRAIRLYMKKIALGESAKQYCSNSSLHGLKYIGDESLTTFERVFWFVAFVAAVLTAGYFIHHLYKKWTDSPIIISMSPESIAFEEFPFPSVTVCNMNNVMKTEANRINKGDNKLDKLLLEDLCNFENNSAFENQAYESANWTSILQFMINVSQPCKAMLSMCQWHGNITNCENLFNPTMTDEGMCCNFNSVHRKYLFYNPREWSDLNITYPFTTIDWNPESGYNKSTPPDAIPWRPYGAGKYFGLTLILDSELEEYYCSSTASMGFKMFLHNPVETPKIADFAFSISPGRETRIIIKPQITTAIRSIIRVPKKKRRCFFTSERQLRYYRTYTQKNCLLECEANFTQKICKCVQYYMPKAQNTPICGKKDDYCATTARRAMEYKLYDEEITVNHLNITETPSCNCWPGCFEMNYDSVMTSSRLSSTFEVDAIYLQKSQKYFVENMAVVHLFFADSQFPNYVKSELFGFIEFLSSTGGLLGLFMGFSFLSVAEFVYFITIRLWCRIHGHRRKINVLPANDNHKVVYPFAQ